MNFLKLILLVMCLCISGLVFAQKPGSSYFFVFLNSNPDKKVLPDSVARKLQAAHMRNIGKLYSEEKLVAAGPFEGGGGLFILQNASLKAATELLQTDSAIAAGRFKIEVLPLKLQQGRICKVADDAKMVFYQFIRYRTDQSTVLNAGKLVGNIISSGSYGKGTGGFVILDAKDKAEAESFVNANRKVSKNHSAEIKTLYIGKGTFCE